jgi:hypothetical protein
LNGKRGKAGVGVFNRYRSMGRRATSPAPRRGTMLAVALGVMAQVRLHPREQGTGRRRCGRRARRHDLGPEGSAVGVQVQPQVGVVGAEA